MVGKEGDATRLSGVEVSIPFVAEGRESRATITADECLYQMSPQRAAFKGNVRVRTDDGFELESDTLKYWADEERVFTRDAVRFRRGTTSGTRARDGVRRGGGRSPCTADVRLRMEDGAGPPTDDRGGERAGASRDERLVRFEGGVVVTAGRRELRSQASPAQPDRGPLGRRAGRGDRRRGPRHRGRGGAPGLGRPRRGAGKRLRCRQLERRRSARQGVLAGGRSPVNAASLEVDPGPGEAEGEAARRRAPAAASTSTSRAASCRCRGCPPGRPSPARPVARS